MMATSGGRLPPEFLAKPGTPPIPWKRWIRIFERYLLATGARDYDAERRQAILLNCLGEAGQQIFDSLPTPESAVATAPATSAAASGEQTLRPPAIDIYKETVKLLEAEFTQPVNVTLQQLQFHLRKQQEGESLKDFLSALRALAIPASFGDQTQAQVRKQFMIGVASSEMQERMVLDAALPFDVVLQTLFNIERARREVREWTTASTPSPNSLSTCNVSTGSAGFEAGSSTERSLRRNHTPPPSSRNSSPRESSRRYSSRSPARSESAESRRSTSRSTRDSSFALCRLWRYRPKTIVWRWTTTVWTARSQVGPIHIFA